jgi:recombination protein RecA
MNPDRSWESVARISAGAKAIDDVLGGGWPKGRIVEVYGRPNSGKRSLALAALADRAKAAWLYSGAWVELVDGAYDQPYATACGWQQQDVTYLSTDLARRGALEYVEKVVRKGSRLLVVVSGAHALVSSDDIACRLYDQQMRRLVSAAHATGTCVMFLRDGERQSAPFVSDACAVGNALKYYSSVRVHLAAASWCDKGNAGIVGQGELVKNKLGPAFARFGFVVQHSRGLLAGDSALAANG